MVLTSNTATHLRFANRITERGYSHSASSSCQFFYSRGKEDDDGVLILFYKTQVYKRPSKPRSPFPALTFILRIA